MRLSEALCSRNMNVGCLRNKVIDTLRGIIGKQCILVDAPYYDNIGDVLIWGGTRQCLNDLRVNLTYTCSYQTCLYPKISIDTVILFQGGGNLGDIYPEHTHFLYEIINHYPNNRIVVLPQTVYFQNKDYEAEFVQRIIDHGDIYLCARDFNVYNIYNSFFSDRCLLVPDMAFCLSLDKLKEYSLPATKCSLLIDRRDKETVASPKSELIGFVVRDWPTIENINHRLNLGNRLFGKLNHWFGYGFIGKFIMRCWDYYANHYFLESMIKEGVHLISPFQIVYTTRLHGGILSCLLSKEVTLFDNSYGKNKFFYLTWLKELDRVKLYSYER